MQILAINCGSSSVKCAVVDSVSGRRLHEAQADGLGSAADLEACLPQLLERFIASLAAGDGPQAVAHRIVHGGSFVSPVQVEDSVLERLEALGPLAPLHNPAALGAMRIARAVLPGIPHVATFDTVFHAGMPHQARTYALPRDLCERHGIRRYGFHGLSHAALSQASAEFLGRPREELRVISCHLGNGASVCAIEHGRSIDTSMGMTPLEGLVMGSRSGDIDPGVILHLLREGHMDVQQVDALLNSHSGLLGLTGTQDMRRIEERAAEGEESCRLALAVFGHRVRKYIGAYAAEMGGVDVIAFTGGIGEHSAAMRHRCVQRLGFLGAAIDGERNRKASVSLHTPVIDISETASRVKLLVVAAREDLEMARQAAQVLRQDGRDTT